MLFPYDMPYCRLLGTIEDYGQPFRPKSVPRHVQLPPRVFVGQDIRPFRVCIAHGSLLSCICIHYPAAHGSQSTQPLCSTPSYVNVTGKREGVLSNDLNIGLFYKFDRGTCRILYVRFMALMKERCGHRN